MIFKKGFEPLYRKRRYLKGDKLVSHVDNCSMKGYISLWKLLDDLSRKFLVGVLVHQAIVRKTAST